jgi:hypothetical protein
MSEGPAIPALVARAIEALEGFDGSDPSRLEALEAVAEAEAPFAAMADQDPDAALAGWARLTALSSSAVAASLQRVVALEAAGDGAALEEARLTGRRAQHALARLSAGMRPAPVETA